MPKYESDTILPPKIEEKGQNGLIFFHSISFHNIPLSAEISSFRKFMGELRGKKVELVKEKNIK